MSEPPKIAEELTNLPHVNVNDLEPFQGDLKELTKREYSKLKKSLNENGVIVPFFVWLEENKLLDGHQRQRVFISENWLIDVPVVYISADSEQDAKKKLLVISSQYGKVTQEGWDGFTFDLDDSWIQDTVQFDALPFVFGDLEDGEPEQESGDAEPRATLAERFGVPPFSVLDARQGYWQDRKKAWLSLGIKGEIGRFSQSNALPKTFKNSTQANQDGTRLDLDNGTSIFDPVVCELAYLWFTPKSAAIFDPFAGGSVRGIVAAHLGRMYTGIDLRAEQIEENKKQGAAIVPDNIPQWITGDSAKMNELLPEEAMYDFVFSCPPYADLEVYSDNPDDISTMNYHDFLEAYRKIIRLSIDQLRDNRFACFVVGDVRDKKGNYYNFVGDTVNAFVDAGCSYYNEAILVTPIGTAMMQTSRNFPIGRKLGKTHQNVLVFCKGDWREAVKACGDVDFNIDLIA